MSLLLLLRLLCLFLLTGVRCGVGNRTDEVEVLINLKRFLQENNTVKRGAYDAWPEWDSSPCGWRGVGCDADGRVTSLDLSGSSISGPAFGNFSRLTELAWLDLSENTLRGVGDINQCRGLVHLNLSRNLISGPLDMSGLIRLRTLDVSGNRLQGGIAANFPAICADLVVFNVSTNMLTGNITGLFDDCGKLEYVDLSSNNFSGELWPGIARFRLLSVAKNSLTGSIPPATFREGCKLESLGVSTNQLTGEFPDSISNCANLGYLSLWGNGFTGVIPEGTGELPVLHTLILGNNMFDRHIPSNLANCTKLQFLDISGNMFGGDLQDVFGRLASLKHLILHHNNFTGGIIASGLLQLPLLARLDLSFNDFSGVLPAEVADMKNLGYLILACNKFSGGIPSAYGHRSQIPTTRHARHPSVTAAAACSPVATDAVACRLLTRRRRRRQLSRRSVLDCPRRRLLACRRCRLLARSAVRAVASTATAIASTTDAEAEAAATGGRLRRARRGRRTPGR